VQRTLCSSIVGCRIGGRCAAWYLEPSYAPNGKNGDGFRRKDLSQAKSVLTYAEIAVNSAETALTFAKSVLTFLEKTPLSA